MPAYVIARVNITSPERYADYRALTPDAVAAFGGSFVVRGGAVETLEGPEETRRVVVIRFDSMEKARQFYNSAQYQAAVKIRQEASEGELILVEGHEG